MIQLAHDLSSEVGTADVLRLLEATARRLHAMADAVEEDLEGKPDDD